MEYIRGCSLPFLVPRARSAFKPFDLISFKVCFSSSHYSTSERLSECFLSFRIIVHHMEYIQGCSLPFLVRDHDQITYRV